MDILSIFLFCLTTSISPGPNNIMLLSSGLNFGFKRTIPHLMGINVGFPFMIVAVGLGLGSVIIAYPSIHPFIKLMGIVYLVYLAWKTAFIVDINVSSEHHKPISFIEAAVFQWLNPKAWVMAIGAIATFTSPDNYNHQLILIVAIYLLVGSISMCVWLLMGSSLQKVIRNEQHLLYFNRVMGTLLLGSIIPIMLTEIS